MKQLVKIFHLPAQIIYFSCTENMHFAISKVMTDFLAEKEILELKADHRAERESRYADRIKAVLMLNSGLTPPKVAEYLLLDDSTVRKYLARYLERGLEELCADWHQGKQTQKHRESFGLN